MAVWRLFFALWPAPAERRALAVLRDAWAWPATARPEPDARLHLTLRFVGAWPAERLPALAAARAVQPDAPIELVLDRATVWPNGCAVLEPAQVPAPLLDWRRRLDAALADAGLAPEARAFRPHVTLARQARGTPAPTTTPPLRWTLRQQVLVRSEAGRYILVD